MTRTLELFNPRDKAGEDFNDDVFGFDRVTEDAVGKVEQRPLNVPDQAPKIPSVRRITDPPSGDLALRMLSHAPPLQTSGYHGLTS
jgi:hypothetical protein